jgi:hypothetical protein
MDILDEMNPKYGVAFKDAVSGHHLVIRLPRNESLRILPKAGMTTIYDTLVACEKLSKKRLERGDERRVFGDGIFGGSPMYSSVGVQVSRCGGILDRSTCFSQLSDKHWFELIKMARRAEAAMDSFADASVLSQLIFAKQIIPFKTLSAPSTNHPPLKYFGAIAFGANVFLRCHTDEDFTYSVTQIFLKDCPKYHAVGDRVVAFFCFPTIGVAIPMRAGDFVLFDATVPHCISSRCHSSDDLMFVSFYLKSRVVGLNNNSIPLSRDQLELSSLHQKLMEDVAM